MAMRLRECAVHMDNAHMREYADVDENLIHMHLFAKYCRILGQKKVCLVSLVLFSIPTFDILFHLVYVFHQG